jgi:hypothetical protein
VSTALIHQLFLLNISLQLFDGVATYQGVHLWGEGNPWIHETMGLLGVGPALLLWKAKACGCLVLARRMQAHAAVGVLGVSAVVYGVLSFVPWMHRFLSLATV